LTHFSKQELAKLGNLGQSSIDKIISALSERGLELPEKEEER
jgi:DNA-directed RNA polymerase alpha subunit